MSMLLLFFVVFAQGVLSSPVQIGRIIGGSDAFAGQFPFAAAIQVQTTNTKFFCGGALLNHNYVITSGLCVNGAIVFTIQLGSASLTANDSNRVLESSNDYILHPEFNPDSLEHDLGLIKLRQEVPYTYYIQPINLPTVELLNATDVVAIGWGQTGDCKTIISTRNTNFILVDDNLSDNLQYITVTVLGNEECQLTYGDAVKDGMVCVAGNFNQGTCLGDNGSPLVEYISRRYWMVGVASFVSGNGCESTDPSGYTRTFPYQEWVMSIAYLK